MSFRTRNINISSINAGEQSQPVVPHAMFQVINAPVTSSLTLGLYAAFVPEVSVIMPYASSVAALSAKVYNIPITAGSLTLCPALPVGAGVVSSSFITLNSSTPKSFAAFPRGLIPFLAGDPLQVVYSASSNYVGPSGSIAGLRVSLWVHG